jgi:hypothetical protein
MLKTRSWAAITKFPFGTKVPTRPLFILFGTGGYRYDHLTSNVVRRVARVDAIDSLVGLVASRTSAR